MCRCAIQATNQWGVEMNPKFDLFDYDQWNLEMNPKC